MQNFALEALSDEHLQKAGHREILQRVIRNLLSVAEQNQDAEGGAEFHESAEEEKWLNVPCERSFRGASAGFGWRRQRDCST